MGMQVRMRSLSASLGSECNRKVDQGNYMDNVCVGVHKHALHTGKNEHTLTHTGSLQSAQTSTDIN